MLKLDKKQNEEIQNDLINLKDETNNLTSSYENYSKNKIENESKENLIKSSIMNKVRFLDNL
jgi:ElaB/YqjD/DUF883 family membrane-anchored ribosome-binding protein